MINSGIFKDKKTAMDEKRPRSNSEFHCKVEPNELIGRQDNLLREDTQADRLTYSSSLNCCWIYIFLSPRQQSVYLWQKCWMAIQATSPIKIFSTVAPTNFIIIIYFFLFFFYLGNIIKLNFNGNWALAKKLSTPRISVAFPLINFRLQKLPITLFFFYLW